VAAAAGVAGIVIADTSALMVAIYSGMLFEDGALYRYALQRQAGYDATLVTGLDLPWVADGLQRNAAARAGRRPGARRLAARRRALPGGVRHGAATPARRAGGIAGPGHRLRRAASALRRPPWVWVCEKCSDPECEHRLFRGLVNTRPPLRH
jgi:hypothetical protein